MSYPPYTVALQDVADLPPHERATAEGTYAGVLERLLGGPQGVAESLAAVRRVQARRREKASTDAPRAIRRWARAATAARKAALRQLRDTDGAFFLVRTE